MTHKRFKGIVVVGARIVIPDLALLEDEGVWDWFVRDDLRGACAPLEFIETVHRILYPTCMSYEGPVKRTYSALMRKTRPYKRELEFSRN